MQSQSPFRTVVSAKLMNEEELLQTASFFHPDQERVMELAQSMFKSPPSNKTKLASYKPPKPQSDNSKYGSPQDTKKRPGVKYVNSKKTSDIIQPEVLRSIQRVSLQRPSNNMQVLKKQSLSQQNQVVPVLVIEKKFEPNSSPPLNKSRMHITLQQRQQIMSPSPSGTVNTTAYQEESSQISQAFNDGNIIQNQKVNLVQDPTSMFIENHEKFLQQVHQHQLHQYLVLQQKKIQHDLKLKQLQQRFNQAKLQDGQSQDNDEKSTDLQQEKQSFQTPQSSLQNSQLFRTSHGSFRANGVLSEQPPQSKIEQSPFAFQSKNTYHYKSVQKMVELKPQIVLPRINSGKEFIKITIQNGMRKSQTAQDTSREQFQGQFQSTNLESKDLSTVLPQINSPQCGTLQGFGTKQAGKSFLTRRPQAKIVSRIFSSKSDKN